jgi:hypothetical protein
MQTRKELKEQYKKRKYKMGVFQIKNLINNKIFIGSSQDLEAIWHAQRLQLNVGIHSNGDLQKDWKEFGSENFIFEIVEMIKQNEDKPQDFDKDLKALEEMVVEKLQHFESYGYNKKLR